MRKKRKKEKNLKKKRKKETRKKEKRKNKERKNRLEWKLRDKETRILKPKRQLHALQNSLAIAGTEDFMQRAITKKY